MQHRHSIRLPGAILSQTASTQKLSKIILLDVPGRRKRPLQTAPFVAATYVSISKTCPSSCVFKDAGCFAQNGFIRRFTRPLDLQAAEAGLDGLQVARNEAKLIDASFGGGPVPQDGARGGRDLRLHVGGDVASTAAAAVLAEAVNRWHARGGGEVWTYTHRWREIPVATWGRIHIWASTETAAEAVEATRLGYRASITLPVGSYTGGKKQLIAESSGASGAVVSVLPCPWEERRIPCNRCRLCLRPRLPGNPVIGFSVHGHANDIGKAATAVAKKRLPVVRNENQEQRTVWDR